MGLFNWGKKQTEPGRNGSFAAASPVGGTARTAPGTDIRYYAGLIDKLKRDHQALFASFGAVQSAFKNGDVARAASELSRFRVAINSHLMMEGVRLYAYLDRELAEDVGNQTLVRDFRQEMDGIGQAVVGFLTKYAELGRNESLSSTFGRDLEAVGKVLTQRIQREEALLYPLYSRSARH
ncbi:MAG: hemerythrin domain-containing protein [Betaproteobacteria bacterium]|nr:hemerythrin domain-containing protein [Betaproteobacteria bacterium]